MLFPHHKLKLLLLKENADEFCGGPCRFFYRQKAFFKKLLRFSYYRQNSLTQCQHIYGNSEGEEDEHKHIQRALTRAHAEGKKREENRHAEQTVKNGVYVQSLPYHPHNIVDKTESNTRKP